MSENPTAFRGEFEQHGLNVILSVANARLAEQYGGIFPEGTLIGELDFLPQGRDSYDPTHFRSDLLDLFSGYDAFFKTIDQGSLPKPEYLIGTSNGRMAAFEQRRLGYTIKDLSPDITNPDDKKYSVVGITDVVRKNFNDELANRVNRAVKV